MASNRWTRLVELFESALAMPAGDREPWLRLQCGADPGLLAEALGLLQAADAESQASLPKEINLAGRRYGPWETVRLLGSGGMGSVLLVKRVDGEFEQSAALKLIAPHLAGPYFLERFRAERQILAHLNHPNITKLLDGGVAEDSGVPYLVMEYVDGLSFDQFADTHKLSLPARLRLFLQVCDAVEFAHRNLVIHRDLKPGNIMVETATGIPKLLDFGTARLMPAAGADDANPTLYRLVTPRYASPEALRHAPITTQADVFSLGVLLYEQVTGSWPFGNPTTPADAVARITSGLLSAPDSTLTLEVAESRSSSLRDLRHAVRGDLTKILSKATRPELTDRYRSVEEFAADLRAYLAGKPVSAQNPTPWYRASKFLRRNWLPSCAVAALAIGLTAAAIYSYREANRTLAANATLRTISSTLLKDLNLSIQDIPGSTAAQKLMVARLVPVLDKLTRQAASDDPVRLDLAEALRELGDLQGNPYSQNLGDRKGALETLEKARQITARSLLAHPNDIPAIEAHALVSRSLGETHFASGSAALSLPHLQQALAAREKLLELLGPAKTTPLHLAEAAAAHGNLGDLYGQPGAASLRKPTEAAHHYTQGIELSARALQLDPAFKRSQRAQVINRMRLGDVTLYTGPARSLAGYQQALADLHRFAFENTPRLEQWLNRKLGEASHGLGHEADAQRYYLKALSFSGTLLRVDPADARARFDHSAAEHGLARIHIAVGNPKKAIPLLEDIVANLQRTLQADSGDRTTALNLADNRCLLAEAHWEAGDRGRSEALVAQALPVLEALANQPDAALNTLELASLHFRSIRPDRFRNTAKSLQFARLYAARANDDLWALYILATALEADGDREATRQTANRALPLLEPGPSDLRTRLSALAAK